MVSFKFPILTSSSPAKSCLYCFPASILIFKSIFLVLVQVIDKQHTLGIYVHNPLDDGEDEIRHIVKLDLPNPSSSSDTLRAKKGLAFLQEYKFGDLCVGKDVDDTVIKGGVVGSETIERSASVRYFCGATFEILDVSEDHTCHYNVDVSVPDLCAHSLFKTQKKEGQVIKCLPVRGEI